jgi:hypothetical protein
MRKIFKILFILLISEYHAQQNVDTLINNWHYNAASANTEKYFEIMDENFIFMGTAPGERWNKIDFYNFCKPYFDKKKTWNFIASNRNWQYNKDSTIAWFDEDLATWMGGCRGNGILVKNQVEEWNLIFYNLCVLIENEKMKSFIRLRNKKKN